MSEAKVLQFQPFTSNVSIDFWFELAKRKLEQYKLSEEPVPLTGLYNASHYAQTSSTEAVSLPSLFQLSKESFEHTGAAFTTSSINSCSSTGTMYNTNTTESFVNMDKKILFDRLASQIWSDIQSGKALDKPSTLTAFLLVAFADIKKYKFYYWFAFPALFAEPAVTSHAPQPATTVFTAAQWASISSQIERPDQPNFFALVREGDLYRFTSLRECFDSTTTWSRDQLVEKVVFGFTDSSKLESHPGWIMRNFLMLIAVQFGVDRCKVLSYRGQTKHKDDTTISDSLVFDVQMASIDKKDRLFIPKSTGWERNAKNQLSAKFVNLSSTMDPIKLMSSSVDLNLRLMQWRLMPSLDLSRVSGTKCLLLGAGTLGCNVARSLMSWGVRQITLVDSGTVSYSNPTRQSLFEFADCLHAGKPKAQAAADKLKQIFPGMEAVGVVMSIPMPGHPIPKGEEKDIESTVDRLRGLIREHDVVFMLTDSRESRWLPTLLAAAEGKLAINAALGFDTYLVLRHGLGQDEQGNYSPHLGCYFCNDVVAPQNSLRERTLDQQCTVTRPGLSSIASALAVELMVSVLHHPDRGCAAADASRDITEKTTLELGNVPHSIRGFLTHFNSLIIEGKPYNRCTACSPLVVNELKKDGFGFLAKVFNEPNYLEDVTGITEMKQEAQDVQWEIDEDL